jgi:hypothetical protein
MSILSTPLRDRIDEAYGRFLDAFDQAARSVDSVAVADLNDATDALMRALARVVIELGVK